jgi:hypothetical protein
MQTTCSGSRRQTIMPRHFQAFCPLLIHIYSFSTILISSSLYLFNVHIHDFELHYRGHRCAALYGHLTRLNQSGWFCTFIAFHPHRNSITEWEAPMTITIRNDSVADGCTRLYRAQPKHHCLARTRSPASKNDRSDMGRSSCPATPLATARRTNGKMRYCRAWVGQSLRTPDC